MANFLTSFYRTLKTEGGFTIDPDDNGNWTGGRKGVGVLVGTNYGITAADLAAHLGHIPTVSDMKFISLDVVKAIYSRNYWDQIWGDKINSQDIANDIYDAAVNEGVGTAIKQAYQAKGIPPLTHMTELLVNALNNVQ